MADTEQEPAFMKRDRSFFKRHPRRKIMIRKAIPNEEYFEGKIIEADGQPVADDPMSQLKAMANIPIANMECPPDQMRLVIVFRVTHGTRGRVGLPCPRHLVRALLKCDESRLEWMLGQLAPEMAHLMSEVRV